jgi:lipopolysaccharide export system protein LptA
MKAFRKYGLLIYLFLCLINIQAQEIKKINIIDADVARFDKSSGITARRLIGNVIFKHEDALMYCDSAWFFPEINTMDAYGSVRIEQGDSVHMSGKYMRYDGNNKQAMVRDSVLLIHKNSKLRTDSLNYDRVLNFGYFFGGGEIQHDNIHIKSKKGYYFPDTKEYFAVNTVKLTHPDYSIFSDSLKYNTDLKISHFLSPSHIVSDSARIKCQYGWYDSKNDISAFGENTVIYQDAQTIWADSIYYDRVKQYGKAWKNIFMLDTSQNFASSGNYAEYDEKTNRTFITDSALAMFFQDFDTTYIHSDTIFVHQQGDSTKKINAYYHVRIFSTDLQGQCDSLVYSDNDSVSHMFGTPILWAEENQITADTIVMQMKNNSINQILLRQKAFIASQEDSTRFSQISGLNMIAWIQNNELYKIHVLSNAETIYYAKEEDTDEIIGVNKEVSNEMIIFREDKKVQRIDFNGNPEGAFFPEKDANPEDLLLRNFFWHNKIRPLSLNDIFIWHN